MFCGNASVTFNNEIHNAWLNDLSPFNTNIFNEIKKNPLDFYNTFKEEAIKYYNTDKAHIKEYYRYLINNESNFDNPKRACIQLIIIQCCFRGYIRFKNNKFNNYTQNNRHTFDTEGKPLYYKYNLDYIKDVSNLLQNIKLTNLDYRELFKLLDPDKHFIYLDPPYLSTNKSYYHGNWTLDSLKELKNYLDEWSLYNGKFALSENNILIKDMFKDYNIYEKDYKYIFNPKNINTKKELLVTNF